MPCFAAITARARVFRAVDGQQTHDDFDSDEDEGEDGYYPGIVNISGTYCFMDSTIQVRIAWQST